MEILRLLSQKPPSPKPRGCEVIDSTHEPAYPQSTEIINFPNRQGMSLRDYFAAKAMQGLRASDVEYTMAHSVIAELAYKQADAMMEARK